MQARVVLITGASSGFGKASAAHLARLGHRVYGTSRQAELPDPAEDSPGPVMIPLDVRSDESVAAAVNFVLEREGRIDVVVNNAGIVLAGAIEDCSVEETRNLFETNVFGVQRVCRAVLPAMRERRAGLIVNIGSLGGEIAIPFQATYSASKSALAALSDALRVEVRPFGIRVTLVEPGDFRTEGTAHRIFAAASRTHDAYRERCDRAVGVMARDEQNGSDPRLLAELLAKLIERESPRSHYRLGMASQKLVAALRPLVPGALFERWLASYYRC